MCDRSADFMVRLSGVGEDLPMCSVHTAAFCTVKRRGQGDRRAKDGGSNSWGTPPWLVAALQAFYAPIGGLQLDAAAEPAGKRLGATMVYSGPDGNGADGRRAPWAARTYCNPPYGTPGLTGFSQKQLEENLACDLCRRPGLSVINVGTKAHTFLCPTRPSSPWYQALLRGSGDLWGLPGMDAVLEFGGPHPDLRSGRIAFVNAEGLEQRGTGFPSSLFYAGPEVERFVDFWRPYGTVLIPRP